MKWFNGFIRWYVAFILVMSPPFLVSYVFSLRSGELEGVRGVVDMQARGTFLYGPKYEDNTHNYKLELVRRLRPDVVALGSSRVLQLRSEFFRASFVNCGTPMCTVAQSRAMLERILADYAPKAVLVALDVWQFNSRFAAPSPHVYSDTSSDVTMAKITDPLRAVLRGEIPLSAVWEMIAAGNRAGNPYTNHGNIGLAAIVHGNGYRFDGSYLAASQVLGVSGNGFADVLKSIDAGEGYFRHGDAVNQFMVEELVRLQNLCVEKGIDLIFFLAPLPREVLDRMDGASGRYAYIREMHSALDRNDVRYYDYLDPCILGADDCEFIDGTHGGDVLYQRLLLDMAWKDSGFGKLVHVRTLEENVRKFKGHALTVFDHSLYKVPEKVNGGCGKP